MLNYICTVCRPWRTFLRRKLDVPCKAHHPTHHLRLNHPFHKDLLWWRIFLPSWNGLLWPQIDPFCTLGSLHRRMPVWLRCLFRRRLTLRLLRGQDVPLSRSITFKDLFAITAAVNTWAASLACRNILFHCDNLSTVHTLSSGTSK